MKPWILASALLLSAAAGFAQIDKSSDLFRTLKTNDSLLFSVGFNTGDIKPFTALVSDNFEFYHDKAGPTLSKSTFLTSITNGLFKLPYKPRRELVDSSLEVYPLENRGVLYGAIQTGVHRFYSLEPGKPETQTDVARFTHVWLLEEGTWKLSRVLSYDHRGM